jgi:diketogulonate reductase-like aldo/keto reductase
MTNEIRKADDRILGILPVIGLGTWEMNGSGCIGSVITALYMGYRHIDTAQIYGNEREVGKAIAESGVRREEIFLTTKISTSNLTSLRIRRSAKESLEKLNTDYVDLLLIHWPTESMNLEECLGTMFELRYEGLVKNVGVSNFDPLMFRRALEVGPVMTNQVKFTPYHEEFENLRLARERKRIITAYSPLARGGIAHDTILGNIGRNYGKTASQVTLRWLIQLGNVSVIPKAGNERHQKENMDIFDFELNDEDMQKISQLSKKPVWH